MGGDRVRQKSISRKDLHIPEPRLAKGAPPLLFDRLVQGGATGETGLAGPGFMNVGRQCLSASDMLCSVIREVGWLLNTRHSMDPAPSRVPPSVVNYGIPELSGFSPQSLDQREELGRILERVIEAFEPRLQQVHVRVEDPNEHGLELVARVEAQLVVGTVMQPVAFPVSLHQTRHTEEAGV
jgi:type VI secretion system protein ImpF